MMEIYIPTFGRTHLQTTWRNLSPDVRKRTTLVCVKEEADALRKLTGANVLIQPPHVKTISAKRQWIVEQCDAEKLVMLDDDLRLCVRDPKMGTGRRSGSENIGGGVALNGCGPKDVDRMFEELEEQLDDHAHAGISMRMGNQSQEPKWLKNKRMIFVLAYDVARLRQFARFDSIAHREDMWVTLTLLTHGLANSVSYEFAIDSAYARVGGESSAGRTMDKSNADAVKLAEAFPDYVKVSEKAYKSSTPRKEVVVQWSKAWQDYLS